MQNDNKETQNDSVQMQSNSRETAQGPVVSLFADGCRRQIG